MAERKLTLALVLEYEGAAYAKFIGDTKDASAAALAGVGDLNLMATAMDGIGGAADLSPTIAALEETAVSLKQVADASELTGAGLEGLGGGEASTDLAALGQAGEEAQAGLQGLEAAATEAAGASATLSATEAKAAVALAQLAEADQRVVVAERELIAAFKLHGAGSAEAKAATDELVAAERSQVEAAEAVAKTATQAGQGLGEFSDKTKGVAAGVTAVVAALAVAANAAAEYNLAITNVSTLGTEAAAHFDEFHKGILDVSVALGQNATTAATGLYNALSAGIPADNAISFMETAGKAAVAGVSDISTSVSALSVGVNAFNLKASDTERVSDALFTTVKLGVTNFGDLGAAFGGVAGIASASNATIEETLASLAQITTKGFSTSQAVTGLKAAFVSLSNPMVVAALNAEGFANGADAVKQIGLQGTLELIAKSAEDTGTDLIKMVGSSEAANAILSTTGINAGAARSKLEEFGHAAGATAAAFELISETPAQRMKVFESSVQAATISIGDALLPVLGGMLDAVTPLVQIFTGFTQDVLVPFGAMFNDLPEPIRLTVAAIALLVGGGAALITAYSVAQPMLLSLAPTLFGTAGAATAAGTASGAAAGGVGLLSSAASSLWATMGPLLPVIGAVVAVMSIISVSSNAAEAALASQFETLDKGSASFEAYTFAAEKARLEGDSWVESGNQWRDGMRDLSDDWLIAKDAVGGLGEKIGGALSSAGDSVSSFLGIGKGVKPVIDEFSSIEVSTGAILDAGQAFLEMGTNIDPAILASEDFRLAQAKLNEQVRDGKLDQGGYEDALLSVANASSMAAGSGSVLSNIQVKVRDSFLSSISVIADGEDILSGSTLASEEFATKQAELADAVAKGTIEAADARKEWEAFIDVLAAGDTEAQKQISANKALSSGFEDLKASLGGGTISFDEATFALSELGASAGATTEQLAAMSGDLMGLAIPDDLAELGFNLSMTVGMDGEKMQEALDKVAETAHSGIASIFADQIQARRDFQSEEASLVNERPKLIAEAEAKIGEEIAKAQAEGKGDRVAELQTQLGEEVAAINTGNAEKLAAHQAGYAAETQARRDALAQTLLDQTNSLLQLGKISADQAFRIFDELKAASPGSHLFDEEGAATLKISAAFGQATSANVETARAGAEALGQAVLDIEGTAEASAALTEQRESEGIARVQAHDAAITASTDLRVGALQTQMAAGEAALGTEVATDQGRIDSSLSLDGVMQASTDARVTMRGTETAASMAAGDSILSDDARTGESAGTAAATVETEHQRMILARQDAASASKTATGEMIADGAKLATATKGSVGQVDTSVRGIGQAYQSSGAAVRIGIDAIVTGTQAGQQALSNLGTSIPANLAPAGDSIAELGKKAAILGEDLDGVAGKRQSADKDTAGVAEETAGTTVESFGKVADQSVETAAKVTDLGTSIKELPKEVSIPFEVTGLKDASIALAQLKRDIKLATGVYSLTIEGTYKGLGAMKPEKSLQLQHDIEDAIAAAKPGINLAGSYSGTGAMAWSNGKLGLEDALASIAAVAGNGIKLLLFDPAQDAADVQEFVDGLAAAEQALIDATAAAEKAKAVLPRTLDGISEALANFFTSEPAAGGLAFLVQELGKLGVLIDASFFSDAGILDVSNFDELRAQIDSLADDPKAQEELWDTFIDALTNKWKIFYEKQENELERQARDIKRQIQDIKAGDEEAETPELDAALKAVERQLQLLKEDNEDINLGLKEQTFNVEAQFDLWGRVNKAVSERIKLEEDARKARDAAIKALEDEIKRQQKSLVDAEKDAHDQAMDLLDAEVKRRDKAHKAEMRNYELRKKWLEADVAKRIKDEEDLHKARLSKITELVDKADAANSAEEERLSRARLLIDAIKGEVAITAADEEFLRSMGIDPEQVKATNAGLEETVAKIDLMKQLLDKLPDEPGRIRAEGTGIHRENERKGSGKGSDPIAEITPEERAALQARLDSGELSKSDARIASIFLAGGVVQAERLREVIGKQVTDEQAKVELGQKQVDLADQLLSKRELALKLAQDNARVEREGLEERIRLEDESFEAFKTAQEQRLTDLETERKVSDEIHSAWKDAISERKDLEAERHAERLRQIQEEYALQLLSAGKTDEQIREILEAQAARAAAISAEAKARYLQLIADAEAAAKAAAGQLPSQPSDPVPVPPGTPGPGAPVPIPPPVGPMPESATAFMNKMIADARFADTMFESPTFEGDLNQDQRIIFNGPVTIDRELADELGLLDAARTGAP